MTRLSEQIQVNQDFRNSINLYLDFNKEQKIMGFIPTNSSVKILDMYLRAVEEKKQKATMLIGPYGKGKSHLLLVLSAVLSMEKNAVNQKKLKKLTKKIYDINQSAAQCMERLIKKGERYLTVLISNTHESLNESFLFALSEALKREGLSNLVPDSYYSHAMERISCWKKEYPATYEMYQRELKKQKISTKRMMEGLKNGQKEMLSVFQELYPKLTAGDSFHPLINTDAMKLYENVAHILKEEHGYNGIYIIFDEFSKYIEAQDKKSAGNHMKLIQDMCELSNTSKDGDIFITLVAHKGIKEYGKNLSVQTINSFTGIEGRIKEIYFITYSKNNYELVKNAIIKKEKTIWKEPKIQRYLASDTARKYFGLPAFSSHFTQEEFIRTVLRGCYPLSPVSAYLLLNVSEKVAQNERTVFTFLSQDEENTMVDFLENVTDEEKWVIFADRIYDYFSILFKKEVSNERIHKEWLNAEYALSLAENKAQEKILKTLAVINIVNKKEELGTHGEELFLASGVEEAEKELKRLVERGVLFQRRLDDSYVFKTRATSELQKEIRSRLQKRKGRININEVMLLVSEEKYILPRKYNREQKMTRYFPCEYMEVSRFLAITDVEVLVQEESCDGKVIYLYAADEKDYEAELLEKLQDMPEQMVVVYAKHPLTIMPQLEEYRVILDLKADIDYWKQGEHMLLRKELPLIEEDLEKEMGSCMEKMFGELADKVIFYSEKDAVKSYLVLEREKSLDGIVDEICSVLYEKSICVNNELINKKTIKTVPIRKVRKNLIWMLLNDQDMTPYLTGTSADATIYRALFVETGLHKTENGEIKKTGKNIKEMLSVYHAFFNRSEELGKKLPMKELIKKLTGAPIGMRRGIIPIFLAYAIKESRKDIIVYFGGKEKPLTEELVIQMCEEAEDYSLFISREDEKKKVYLEKMQEIFRTGQILGDPSVKTGKILQTIKNWMNGLPQVTKNMKDTDYFQGVKYLEPEQYVRLLPKFKKKVTDVEANPFEVVFLEIPKIFGVSMKCKNPYETTVLRIRELKEKLDAYFRALQKKTIREIQAVFRGGQELIPMLKDWHDDQSAMAGQGMGSPKLVQFMSFIGKDENFDEDTFLRKMARIFTGVTMDSWNENSLAEFIAGVKEVKEEAEQIGKEDGTGQRELKFIGKDGTPVVRYYNEIPREGYEDTLKEMLRSDLEDFSDIPLNDRIALVLQVLEEMMEGERDL